jgi:ABC-2 type transport system permease protein
LPSPSGARWLARKELRELALSPAFTLLLLAIGVLVGHEFLSSVRAYSELSAGGAAVAGGMVPLDGILVPTFGAYDIAATLLLPFVVIRLFSNERSTGAWTLLVQAPVSVPRMVAVKALALGFAWAVALAPGVVAVMLWRSYGGHVYAPELAALLLGHALRAAITVAIAAAAAAVTRQAASAAIVTLAVTIGAWALDFTAATRGGAWETVARFTPSSALRAFEQGLVRADVVAVTLVASAAGLMIAAVWLSPGVPPLRRAARTLLAISLFAMGAGAGSRLHSSWDVSEDRRHSFSEADEAALGSLPGRLTIEIHLGAEDPRLADLRREILDRLERVVPKLRVEYVGAGGTGLFASADPHYGEIWYELGGKRVMLKSAIEPVVLATVYQLAGVPGPPATGVETYSGHPLRSDGPGSALVFFVLWPALVMAGWWRFRRG